MPKTVKELLHIALSMEEMGYSFYKSKSEEFEDHQLKDIFAMLARDEIEHQKKFKELIEKAHQDDTQHIDIENLIEAHKNKAQLFNSNLNIDTPEEAIKHAFQDEKDSIMYYEKLKELYPENKEVSTMLDTIIKEEQEHIKSLSELKNYILMSQN